MKQTLLKANITAAGKYLPKKVLTNHDLEKLVETSDEWIQSRTGIRERRIVKNGEATAEMSTKAINDLMEKHHLSPEKIDAIIIATITPDMMFPSSASLVQKNIKAIKWLIQIILGISLVFANETISIEFGEVDYDNQIVPILYDSPDVITGFHIFITGMDIIDVYGGISEANNFYLDQGSTCWRDNDCKDFVTGNYTPASIPIPSGSGVLLYVKYEIGDEFDENIIVGPETCLDIAEGFIIGPWIDGASLVYEVTGECIPSPSDCNGNYYGSAFVDAVMNALVEIVVM